jgi:Mor family transcriptional regulator
MSAKIAARLVSIGIESGKAEEIAQAVTEEMSEDWGGQLIYFPINLASRRNCLIYEKFTGDNHADLATEFEVSVQHVYRVVKIQRAAEIALRQSGLFPS